MNSKKMKVQYRGVPVKIPMTKIIIEVRLGSTQCVHISFRYNMLKKNNNLQFKNKYFKIIYINLVGTF